MNIIHFSDIHFELCKSGNLSYEKEQLYNALVNDLKSNQYVNSDSIMVISKKEFLLFLATMILLEIR